MTANIEIKYLIDIAFEGVSVVEDIVNKSYVSMITDMVKLAESLPSAISNFSDLQTEIAALPGTTQEQDLVSYIESKFSGIGTPKAQSILSVALKMITDLVVVIQDALALKVSIQS